MSQSISFIFYQYRSSILNMSEIVTLHSHSIPLPSPSRHLDIQAQQQQLLRLQLIYQRNVLSRHPSVMLRVQQQHLVQQEVIGVFFLQHKLGIASMVRVEVKQSHLHQIIINVAHIILAGMRAQCLHMVILLVEQSVMQIQIFALGRIRYQ